jgi:hypothetical protein
MAATSGLSRSYSATGLRRQIRNTFGSIDAGAYKTNLTIR